VSWRPLCHYLVAFILPSHNSINDAHTEPWVPIFFSRTTTGEGCKWSLSLNEFYYSTKKSSPDGYRNPDKTTNNPAQHGKELVQVCGPPIY